VDVSSSPGASTALDAPPGQLQIMMLRDALQVERTQSAALVQALPSATGSAPGPSLEQGKGASFDSYA
jgi:hypothetical protein